MSSCSLAHRARCCGVGQTEAHSISPSCTLFLSSSEPDPGWRWPVVEETGRQLAWHWHWQQELAEAQPSSGAARRTACPMQPASQSRAKLAPGESAMHVSPKPQWRFLLAGCDRDHCRTTYASPPPATPVCIASSAAMLGRMADAPGPAAACTHGRPALHLCARRGACKLPSAWCGRNKRCSGYSGVVPLQHSTAQHSTVRTLLRSTSTSRSGDDHGRIIVSGPAMALAGTAMMTRDWLMRGSLKFMRMVGGCLAGVVAGAQLVAGGSGHVTRALHCMAACCFLQLQCRVEEDSSLSIAEDTSRTLHACMHACFSHGNRWQAALHWSSRLLPRMILEAPPTPAPIPPCRDGLDSTTTHPSALSPSPG